MRNLLKTFAGEDIASFNKATAFAVIEGLCTGAPLFILYIVITKIVENQVNFLELLPYLFMMLICFGAQAVCSIRSIVAASLFAYGTGAKLRLRIGEHLRKLPLGYFKLGASGNFVEALLLDVFNVELAASTMYNKFATSVMLPIIVAVFMAFIDIRLTFLLVCTVPPAMYFLYLFHNKVDQRSASMLSARRSTASHILEYVQGIRTIKSFNLTGDSFSRLNDSLEDLKDKCIMLESTIGPMSEIYSCIASLGFPILIFFGTRMLSDGQVSLPVLLLFMILSLKFYQPLMGIAPYFSILRHLGNSAQNINTILTTPVQTGGNAILADTNLSVNFDNVRFSYGDRCVLDGISFTAPPHSMTALVGPSGAGKTTIANLISRFWDVDSGAISVGNHDVREIDPEMLLSKISMVMQEVHLFNDTIMNNLRFGKPDATDEQVLAAAKAAMCHDFITRLPLGYNTTLGEGGATLSGGEKKRIAIARAILKDAPIVILDEATASLDPENEGVIQQAFSALVKAKTIFVIAHKLATIKDADQILFIENGSIAEQGSFDELVHKEGRFRRFWDLQQESKGWKIRR